MKIIKGEVGGRTVRNRGKGSGRKREVSRQRHFSMLAVQSNPLKEKEVYFIRPNFLKRQLKSEKKGQKLYNNSL